MSFDTNKTELKGQNLNITCRVCNIQGLNITCSAGTTCPFFVLMGCGFDVQIEEPFGFPKEFAETVPAADLEPSPSQVLSVLPCAPSANCPYQEMSHNGEEFKVGPVGYEPTMAVTSSAPGVPNCSHLPKQKISARPGTWLLGWPLGFPTQVAMQ